MKNLMMVFGFILMAISASVSMGAGNIENAKSGFTVISTKDEVIIEEFDDPAIDGVACYLSRPADGSFFIADAQNVKLDCAQIGHITFKQKIYQGDTVVKANASPNFKDLYVFRVFDQKRNVIIYTATWAGVVKSNRPNLLSVVPIQKW